MKIFAKTKYAEIIVLIPMVYVILLQDFVNVILYIRLIIIREHISYGAEKIVHIFSPTPLRHPYGPFFLFLNYY